MNKWDRRYMLRAAEIAGWSKDDIGVGAVIVDSSNRQTSEGYNGVPAGVDEMFKEESEAKIHAEENAVLFARCDLSGQRIYVWPFLPCAHCASILAQVGIVEVIVPEEEAVSEKWQRSWDLAKALFDSKGIKVRKI